VYEGGCANVCIQREMPKRTLIGKSGIAGWGLFMGEKIKAGQFLGEYKGEIISNEESERRGLLYDKKGVSFLFTLNKGPSSTALTDIRPSSRRDPRVK
jgi:SET domain-containing protein